MNDAELLPSDPSTMGVAQRQQQLREDVNADIDRERGMLAKAPQELRKIHAVDPLHHHEWDAAIDPGIDGLDHVGVVELHREPGLGLERLDAVGLG